AARPRSVPGAIELAHEQPAALGARLLSGPQHALDADFLAAILAGHLDHGALRQTVHKLAPCKGSSRAVAGQTAGALGRLGVSARAGRFRRDRRRRRDAGATSCRAARYWGMRSRNWNMSCRR